MHTPFWQVVPVMPQGWLQPPQLSLSDSMSTHWPWHIVGTPPSMCVVAQDPSACEASEPTSIDASATGCVVASMDASTSGAVPPASGERWVPGNSAGCCSELLQLAVPTRRTIAPAATGQVHRESSRHAFIARETIVIR